jgi:phage tail sheath gpL-like
VNLTAKFKGEVGNDIDVRVNRFLGEQLPPGLAVTITPLTLGSGNPAIQDALDAVGDDWMNTIICGYADGANLSQLKSFLDERWGPLEQIGGHAYVSARGSFAALSSLGQTHNSEHLTIDGYKSHPTPPWRRASALGGICSYYGQIDPARPFQTLVMAGVAINDPGDEFSDTARNLLLFDGISTAKVNDGGDKLRVERVVTTYKKNASGFDDPSLRDLNTKLTLQYLRYSWRAWLAQRYPRHKLASDGNSFGAGQKVVTPSVLRGTAADWFKALEDRALVEDFDQFKAELQAAINESDPNRADIGMVPNIVNQFRRSATRVDFIL